MVGYKVFNSDWTCRGFQYEVGMTYSMNKKPVCCEVGYHFCKDLKDCFNYYDFDSNNQSRYGWGYWWYRQTWHR